MKRLVLFGIVIFLVIIGGFLVVDKVWLHKVFKAAVATPGSCLILEEKNCKKIKIVEKDGAKIAVADLPKGSVLFSPIDGHYDNGISFEDNDLGTVVNSGELTDIDNKSYVFRYSKLSERQNKSTDLIKKGDEIGKINSLKLKGFKNYNLVFYVLKKLPLDIDRIAKFGSDDEILLKMFSNK